MLADRVIREGLSVRQTEALAQQRALADRPRRRVSADPADPNTEALARDLSETLGLRVTIRFDGRRGEVRIAYDDLDQLDGLVALLQRAGG